VATDLQIEANRRNAQLTTGPKTERGKEASRMNALKHGLTAQQVTLFDERAEDFEAFHAELLGAWHPRARSNYLGRAGGALRLAADTCLPHRDGFVSQSTQSLEQWYCRPYKRDRGGVSASRPQEDDRSKLTRYEISLERSL